MDGEQPSVDEVAKELIDSGVVDGIVNAPVDPASQKAMEVVGRIYIRHLGVSGFNLGGPQIEASFGQLYEKAKERLSQE